MKKSKVALIKCDTYDHSQAFNAIRAGLDLLGRLSTFVQPGEKIVIKPNVLIGTDPVKGVTTHPVVFQSEGELLLEAGVRVYYRDSPGFGLSEMSMRLSDIKKIADEIGCILVNFDSGREISYKNALLVKKFVIAHGVLDSDGLISFPRLKTHGFLRFTGAVKNQFGCIPRLLKGQYHVKLPDPFDFAAMLVDLNTLINPRLYIMDGITAMKENGPRSGQLKNEYFIVLH